MLLSEKATGGRAARNPLPPKIAALLRESGWFALLALALYLGLILYTYSKADPGWSHSVTSTVIHNSGGRVGAWMADVLLYLFGLSAYWWVVLCAFLVAWGFRRIETVEPADRRSYFVTGVGFALVLAASTGIEAVRLSTLKATLPYVPGGILGEVAGRSMAHALGFTGATLILLILFAAGLSLFTGISWLSVIERVGTWAE